MAGIANSFVVVDTLKQCVQAPTFDNIYSAEETKNQYIVMKR